MADFMQNGVNSKENSFHDGIIPQRQKQFTPTTIDEIKSILGQAQTQRSSVRVIQSPTHNFTFPLTSSSNIFIDLKNFDKIVEIDVSRKLVTVQGGTPLSTISKYLEKVGLTLPIPLLPTDLTVSYAISTAAHVSDIRSGNLSSYVHQLELLTSDGQIIVCSKQSGEDVLKTAACGLGICGIILTVTFQCIPLHTVEHLQVGCSFLKVIDKLDACLQKQGSFRMLWFPHTDNAVIYSSKETKKCITEPHKLKQSFDWYIDVAIGTYFLQFLYWICLFLPFLLPLAHQIIFWLGFIWRRTTVSTASHSFNFQPPGTYHTTEWAIPIKRATEALLKLYEWSSEGVHFLHFPVDIQFVQKDELYLSPAFQTDVCCISLTIMSPFNFYFPYEQAFIEFAELMKSVDGRPCWGKSFPSPQVKENELKDMFPSFDTWTNIHDDLDPYDLFSNNFFINDF